MKESNKKDILEASLPMQILQHSNGMVHISCANNVHLMVDLRRKGGEEVLDSSDQLKKS